MATPISALRATADWNVWGDADLSVYLWQAVLLSMNLEPRGNESLGLFMPDEWRAVRNGVPVPGADPEWYRMTKELEGLLTIAVHGFRGSTPVRLENPKPDDPNWRVVSLGEFGSWAMAKGWEVADRMPRNEAGRNDRPLTTAHRRTLLTIIAALCKKAGIDPASRSATTAIVSATEELGAPVGDDTIRTILKELPDATESRTR